MFGKIIKNKVLCFLLSVAALCPFVHAKNAKSVADPEMMDDVYLREYGVPGNSVSQNIQEDADWEESYETQMVTLSPDDKRSLGDSTEIIEINDTLHFCVPSSDQKSQEPLLKQLPPSLVETQEINVAGVSFLIEKTPGMDEKLPRMELDELLAIREQPVQSVEQSFLSQEEKAKKTEEMKELLKRLDLGKVDSTPKLQSDMEEVLDLSEDSNKKVVSTAKPEEKTLTKEKTQGPKDKEDVPQITTIKKVVASLDKQPAQADSPSKALQNSSVETVQPPKKTEQNVAEIKQQPFEFQSGPKTQEEKKIIYTMGGIGLVCMMFAIPGIFSDGMEKKPRKKRKKKRRYEDDYAQMREMIEDVIQHPVKNLQNQDGEVCVDSVPVTEMPDVLQDKTEEQQFTQMPEKETISEVKTEENQGQGAIPVIPAEIVGEVPASEQKSVDEVSVPEQRFEATAAALTSENASEPESAEFTEVLSKDRHELFQWLCAVKSIYEIQKERAVLKRQMARAKKEGNQEEIDQIKARREILTAKRRAACLRANSKEMQAIKEQRRLLTKQMTLAKRRQQKDAQERITAERQVLKERVKTMNAQIKAVDYAKQWRFFVDRCRQSKQAA